jgi:hypothetical protein
MNEYYVYVYLDPRKPGKYNYGKFKFKFEPFYVGKGKGNRIYCHLKKNDKFNPFKSNKINKIKRMGKIPIFYKIKENLTDNEALKLEIKLIKIIGRHDLKLGTLTNLTNGGDGTSGYKYTKKQRMMRSLYNSFKGKKHTEEQKQKWSRERKGKLTVGKDNGMYGRTPHDIWVEKYGKEYADKKWQECIEKNRIANSGKNNAFYGKKHSDEVKKKLSEDHSKKYKLISPLGKTYEFKNFCRCKLIEHLNLHRRTLGRFLNMGAVPQLKRNVTPLKQNTIGWTISIIS